MGGLQHAPGSAARFAKALVITQVALSFLLVFGAGLFLQTLRNLQAVSLGYPRENLLLIDLDTSGVNQQPVNLDHELTARIRGISGCSGRDLLDRPLLNGFDGAFAIDGGRIHAGARRRPGIGRRLCWSGIFLDDRDSDTHGP